MCNSSCHDLNSWDIWDDIFHIIKSGNDSQGIPEEVKSKYLLKQNLLSGDRAKYVLNRKLVLEVGLIIYF